MSRINKSQLISTNYLYSGVSEPASYLQQPYWIPLKLQYKGTYYLAWDCLLLFFNKGDMGAYYRLSTQSIPNEYSRIAAPPPCISVKVYNLCIESGTTF